MEPRWKKLTAWMLDGNEAEIHTKEQIAELVDTFPYSAPLQFLHTYLMQKDAPAEKVESARSRASIHFSNSLWFDYQLDNADKELPEVSIQNPDDTVPDSTPTTKELLFEPLHMVDYFASQGIKVSGFLENKDELSVKLKSFTEWLRTMKRIHPEKIPASIDQREELQIRKTAETSNISGEILTETMADVYLQQGMTQKAVEIYHKLSLLDPAKSAYFASLIKKITENP